MGMSTDAGVPKIWRLVLEDFWLEESKGWKSIHKFKGLSYKKNTQKKHRNSSPSQKVYVVEEYSQNGTMITTMITTMVTTMITTTTTTTTTISFLIGWCQSFWKHICQPGNLPNILEWVFSAQFLNHLLLVNEYMAFECFWIYSCWTNTFETYLQVKLDRLLNLPGKKQELLKPPPR